MFAEEETTNVRPLRTSRPLPGFHGGSGGHWRRALSSSQLAALGGLANVLVTSYEAGSAVPTQARTTAKSQDKTGQDADADVGVASRRRPRAWEETTLTQAPNQAAIKMHGDADSDSVALFFHVLVPLGFASSSSAVLAAFPCQL